MKKKGEQCIQFNAAWFYTRAEGVMGSDSEDIVPIYETGIYTTVPWSIAATYLPIWSK